MTLQGDTPIQVSWDLSYPTSELNPALSEFLNGDLGAFGDIDSSKAMFAVELGVGITGASATVNQSVRIVWTVPNDFSVQVDVTGDVTAGYTSPANESAKSFSLIDLFVGDLLHPNE